MAFAIGAWAKAHVAPFNVGLQAYHFELADQPITGTVGQLCPTGIAQARAVVYKKSETSGSGTVGPLFELQVAYDVGFTSFVVTLDAYQGVLHATGVEASVTLQGVNAARQTSTYVRVKCTASGTDTMTWDTLIDTLPGL